MDFAMGGVATRFGIKNALTLAQPDCQDTVHEDIGPQDPYLDRSQVTS